MSGYHHLLMRPGLTCAARANPARYERHRPEETMLYREAQAQLDTFLACVDIDTGKEPVTEVKKPTAKKTVAKVIAAKPEATVPAVSAPQTKAEAAKGAGKRSTHKKQKTIRDSFNMPAQDCAQIGLFKKRAIGSGREMKKSELLRAGILVLVGLSDSAYAAAINSVATIKTGRVAKKGK